MNANLVKITLCEDIANQIGKNEYNLCVKSVSESMTAINALTKGKFINVIKKAAKEKKDYAILVNGIEMESAEELTLNFRDNLKTIELVPSIKGAWWIPLIWAVVSAIISYGLNKLLNPTPENKTAELNPSYLINGTVNLAKQGLPVPIGYGRKKIGSQVVSYSTRYINSSSAFDGLTDKQILSWVRHIYNHKTENPFNVYYSNNQSWIDPIIEKYGDHDGGDKWYDIGNVFDLEYILDLNKTLFLFQDVNWDSWDPAGTFTNVPKDDGAL